MFDTVTMFLRKLIRMSFIAHFNRFIDARHPVHSQSSI
ncbi:hypothetical protein OHAE_172 [Ochrobactrum soli]|uniref:Uncharacterized protein n=1 Tax=Ochrobactrum soli TaxID=2448455 RepID=A0A2P9HJM7_9HYPH|nr:hypothetical protein OHAE_172 [[Ochrobactrum] soli]